MRFLRVAVVIASLMVLLATGSVEALAQTGMLPRLLTQDASAPFRVRPMMIGYTGDGTGYIGKFPARRHRGFLHWKIWNHQRAFGKATIWLDDCTPSCAGGTFHAYLGSVRASRVRHGDFTRMTLRFHYHGRSVTDERGLFYTSTYAWGIIKQTGF